MTDYKTLWPEQYEMGSIACAASEISGKTITNPYPEGTIGYEAWEQGYNHEAERILNG